MRPSSLILYAAAVGLACARRADQPSARGTSVASDTLVVRVGIRGDASGAEDFLVRATRPSLKDSVRAELALPAAERRHVNGVLRRARPGENLGWHWAIETDGWSLAEMSIELCDGRPRMVESDLEAWLRTGRFCPWASFVRDTLPSRNRQE